MARLIVCQGCNATAMLYGTEDPHAALDCHCCPEDHDHKVATATTGIPCRPVIHSYVGEITSPGGLIVAGTAG
jgi:hypothetical protein